MANIKKLTFEQACEMTGRNPDCLPYQNPIDKDQEAYNALKRLEIYTEAYNMEDGQKWVADYANPDQPKWRVWFEYDSVASAFRFYLAHHDYTFADSATSLRHVSRNQEIAEHIAIAHIDEWNKWLIK